MERRVDCFNRENAGKRITSTAEGGASPKRGKRYHVSEMHHESIPDGGVYADRTTRTNPEISGQCPELASDSPRDSFLCVSGDSDTPHGRGLHGEASTTSGLHKCSASAGQTKGMATVGRLSNPDDHVHGENPTRANSLDRGGYDVGTPDGDGTHTGIKHFQLDKGVVRCFQWLNVYVHGLNKTRDFLSISKLIDNFENHFGALQGKGQCGCGGVAIDVAYTKVLRLPVARISVSIATNSISPKWGVVLENVKLLRTREGRDCENGGALLCTVRTDAHVEFSRFALAVSYLESNHLLKEGSCEFAHITLTKEFPRGQLQFSCNIADMEEYMIGVMCQLCVAGFYQDDAWAYWDIRSAAEVTCCLFSRTCVDEEIANNNCQEGDTVHNFQRMSRNKRLVGRILDAYLSHITPNRPLAFVHVCSEWPSDREYAELVQQCRKARQAVTHRCKRLKELEMMPLSKQVDMGPVHMTNVFCSSTDIPKFEYSVATAGEKVAGATTPQSVPRVDLDDPVQSVLLTYVMADALDLRTLKLQSLRMQRPATHLDCNFFERLEKLYGQEDKIIGVVKSPSYSMLSPKQNRQDTLSIHWHMDRVHAALVIQKFYRGARVRKTRFPYQMCIPPRLEQAPPKCKETLPPEKDFGISPDILPDGSTALIKNLARELPQEWSTSDLFDRFTMHWQGDDHNDAHTALDAFVKGGIFNNIEKGALMRYSPFLQIRPKNGVSGRIVPFKVQRILPPRTQQAHGAKRSRPPPPPPKQRCIVLVDTTF